MNTIVAETRLAETRDAAALARVHAQAWRGAYSGLIPHNSLSRMIARRHDGWWVRAIRGGAAILVVEFDGEAIGYATLGHNRADAIKAQGEIYELYLKPEYQGLGFGGRLFKAARKLLADRHLQGLVVWALADNDQAVGFYTRLGGADIAEGSEVFEGRRFGKIAFVWP